MGTVQVPLTRGKIALIDEEDAEAVLAYRWCAVTRGTTWYARRAGRDGEPATVLMHRQIMGAGRGEEIDHANRDGLDNRRANLRFCSRRENVVNRNATTKGPNRTGFIGVSWMARSRRFRAAVDGRIVGVFVHAQTAALARDCVARVLHGDFASLNFPEVTRYPIDAGALLAGDLTAADRHAVWRPEGSTVFVSKPDYLSPAEVATIAGCDEAEVRRWLSTGALPATKGWRSAWLIERGHLLAFLRRERLAGRRRRATVFVSN